MATSIGSGPMLGIYRMQRNWIAHQTQERTLLMRYIKRNQMINLLRQRLEAGHSTQRIHPNDPILRLLDDILQDQSILESFVRKLRMGGFNSREVDQKLLQGTLTLKDILNANPTTELMARTINETIASLIPRHNFEQYPRQASRIIKLMKDREYYGAFLLSVNIDSDGIKALLNSTFDNEMWLTVLGEYLVKTNAIPKESLEELRLQGNLNINTLVIEYNKNNFSLLKFIRSLNLFVDDMTPPFHAPSRSDRHDNVDSSTWLRTDSISTDQAIEQLSCYCNGTINNQDQNNKMIKNIKGLVTEIERYIADSKDTNTTILDLILKKKLALNIPLEDLEDCIHFDMVKIPVICFCEGGGQTLHDAFSLKKWIETSGALQEPKTRQKITKLEINVIYLGRILSLLQDLKSKLSADTKTASSEQLLESQTRKQVLSTGEDEPKKAQSESKHSPIATTEVTSERETETEREPETGIESEKSIFSGAVSLFYRLFYPAPRNT